MSHDGGSITERHLLYALALRMISILGRGEKLVLFLKQDLQISLNTRLEAILLDSENAYYAYDLLGVLKSDLVQKFYIQSPAIRRLKGLKMIIWNCCLRK